jgi:hypothetical protein
MKRIILLSLLTFLVLTGYAQVTATRSDTLRKDALNVFMPFDDYIRKEIPYINYVRDIKDAGVYIISTTATTGSGGHEYTFFLVGQNENAGMADTLKFTSAPDETTDEIRIKRVNLLKMGLMRYIVKTPLAKYMRITFTEPLSETVSSDKWDSWVIKTNISGYIQEDETYKTTSLSGNLSASRITKDWKINLAARYSINKEKINYGGGITSESNSKSFSSLVVKSISDHWSYGGSFSLRASLYNNLDLSLIVMPGIEYDLFPYSESTRRQLRILYSAGYNYAKYPKESIYSKMKEGHLQHSLSLAYEVVQKWGSAQISAQYSNYLHDWSKNNFSLDEELNFRIAKGLSVNIFGSASLIHDQLSLVKGDASTEDVLLRVRELETQFQYYIYFGFTYTFGSIYNNVVNPRFGN